METILFDGTLNTLPTEQGYLFLQGNGYSQADVLRNNRVTVNSLNGPPSLGYMNYSLLQLPFPITGDAHIAPFNARFPVLNATEGYNVSFNLALDSEQSSDPNQAGLSLLVVSEKEAGEIELGFTETQIFAKNADFIPGESVNFNTQSATDYQLAVKDQSYTLLANGQPILSGPLRNYGVGATNTYSYPNWFFLGDNADRASSQFSLGSLSIEVAEGLTESQLPARGTSLTSSPAPFPLKRRVGTEGEDLIIPSIHPLSQNSIINLFGGLWALDGDDRVFGSPFSEIILGNQGDDQLWGGGDGDRLLGGQGNDFLFGGELHDLVRGDLDSDRLWGDSGNDTLRGGQGNDTLQGGAGQDFLVGDLGFDLLTGGEDVDTLVLRHDEAHTDPSLVDRILDWNGNEDRIGLTDGLTFADLELDITGNVGGTVALDTVIKIRATGQSLGALIDHSSGLSADHFISLSPSEMQTGADVFNPQIMPYISSIPDVVYIPNIVPPIPE